MATTVAAGTLNLVPVDNTNIDQVLGVEVAAADLEFVLDPAALLASCSGEDAPAQALALEVEGEIVGVCAWMRSAANALWLSNLQIDRRRQGQGFGEQAIRALARFAAERGMAAIDLSYHPWNTAAERLYRRCGFVDLLDLPQIRMASLPV